VPERFCEQEYVPSLQTAVAVPHGAAIGEGTVQMLEPGGGDGGPEGGAGAEALGRIEKSTRRSPLRVTVRSVVSNPLRDPWIENVPVRTPAIE
jgi:hypothetical protein